MCQIFIIRFGIENKLICMIQLICKYLLTDINNLINIDKKYPVRSKILTMNWKIYLCISYEEYIVYL